MKENEYKCGHCGEINEFDPIWTDEDAKKEAEINFGKHPDEWKDEQVMICDDCYTQMFPPMHPDLVEKAKKFL